MSRITGVQDHEADAGVLRTFKRIKRVYGHIPLSARIRALDPELLRLSEKMSGHTAQPGTVLPKLKELAQLKVAAMVGCQL